MISGDPPYKDENAQVTTVPMKPLSDQGEGQSRFVVFLGLKVCNSDNSCFPAVKMSKSLSQRNHNWKQWLND